VGPSGVRKIYDFSEVDPASLKGIRGPAARLYVEEGSKPNKTELTMSGVINTNGIGEHPYTKWVSDTMLANCSATGNGWGNIEKSGDLGKFIESRGFSRYNQMYY
jgi:hypothetical protein